jgi:hypothetical protein
MDGPYDILLPHGWRSIHFCNKWGLPWNILPGEPCHLPLGQLLDPVRLLMFSISCQDDEVWCPSFVIGHVPFGAIAGWEGDCVSVVVQLLLEVRYFVAEGFSSQGVLLIPLSYGGGEALGNVEDGDWVVLVELHHRFGRAGGDGSRRGHGGPNGG